MTFDNNVGIDVFVHRTCLDEGSSFLLTSSEVIVTFKKISLDTTGTQQTQYQQKFDFMNGTWAIPRNGGHDQ